MNPHSPIILIGDDTNDCFDFVEHVNMRAFEHAADSFNRQYKHRSPNDEIHERFCFQRWFVLKEFLTQSKIDQCLHLDSDVMLYINATNERKIFSANDLTLSSGRSAHCCFISGPNVLHAYCDMVLHTYSSQSGLQWMEKEFERINRISSGGICDMTFFEAFSQSHPGTCVELGKIVDGAVYDDNINASDGYAMRDGIKDIRFVGRIPFSRHKESETDVQFKTLHFQGRNGKRNIGRFLQHS